MIWFLCRGRSGSVVYLVDIAIGIGYRHPYTHLDKKQKSGKNIFLSINVEVNIFTYPVSLYSTSLSNKQQNSIMPFTLPTECQNNIFSFFKYLCDNWQELPLNQQRTDRQTRKKTNSIGNIFFESYDKILVQKNINQHTITGKAHECLFWYCDSRYQSSRVIYLGSSQKQGIPPVSLHYTLINNNMYICL